MATAAPARIADYGAQVRRAGVGFRDPERLSPTSVAEERLLMGLRTQEGVALAELAPLGLFAQAPVLADAASQGLLMVTGAGSRRPRPAGGCWTG